MAGTTSNRKFTLISAYNESSNISNTVESRNMILDEKNSLYYSRYLPKYVNKRIRKVETAFEDMGVVTDYNNEIMMIYAGYRIEMYGISLATAKACRGEIIFKLNSGEDVDFNLPEAEQTKKFTGIENLNDKGYAIEKSISITRAKLLDTIPIYYLDPEEKLPVFKTKLLFNFFQPMILQ